MKYLNIFLLLLLISTACTSNKSDDTTPQLTANRLTIQDAWARPGMENGNSGAYMTILNGTSETDTLLSVNSNLAASTELHQSFQQANDVMGMRPAGPVTLEPESILELRPGGYHIMLMQLNRSLSLGDSLSVTLYFAKTDSINIIVPVKEYSN